MHTLIQDLRFAARTLLKKPGFTAVAVLTLALGIGANTAIFSVVYALLLKPLPYAQPDRLVAIRSTNPAQGDDSAGVAPETLADLRAAAPPGIEKFAASLYDYANLTGVAAPTQLTIATVTADYFNVLGVTPKLGRGFNAAESRAAAPAVVVLSHKIWQTQFGGDPGILGRTITLGAQARTVVGVLPADFKEPRNVAEAWVPLADDAPEMRGRANRYLTVVARLAPGGGLAAANAALRVVSENLARAFPQENAGWSLVAQPLTEEIVSEYRRAVWLLFGAVGCVLLITCVNVANLQLVRASARRRELDIRLALGAGRWRIARQLLTESLLLALVGGAGGALLAAWGVDAIRAWLPEGYSPRQDEIAFSLPVLGFTAAMSLLTGVVFGALPAWFAGRQKSLGVLGSGRTASESPGGVRARALLVVAELTLAVVLLAGGGLVLRSFLSVLRVEPGLRTERVLTLGLSLSEARYPAVTARAECYRQILERTRAVPGVAGVGLSSTKPFNWSLRYPFLLAGQVAADPSLSNQQTSFDCVNPPFFSALDIPIRAGRGLDEHDSAGAPVVAVINASFAKRWFPQGDPLGQKLTFFSFRTPLTVEIVGVAADVRRSGLENEPPAQVYVSYLQRPLLFATLFVRAAGPALSAESLTRAVQGAIWSVDPEQPVTNVSTLARAVDNSLASMRLHFLLFALFAGLALGLAALGLYTTIAFAVSQRTREIGIRLALGAGRANIFRLVVGGGMKLTAVGVVVGVLAALGLTRLFAGLLYGVGAHDPLTFCGVVALLVVVALFANYLPARRAMQVDPTIALREE